MYTYVKRFCAFLILALVFTCLMTFPSHSEPMPTVATYEPTQQSENGYDVLSRDVKAITGFKLEIPKVVEVEKFSVNLSDNKSILSEENDGYAKDVPYGVCSIVPSFNCDYYDCFIPYNLTCYEVGGYADIMGSYGSQIHTGVKLNWEGDIGICREDAGTCRKDYDPNTGATMYVSEEGTQFYVAAIPSFCYNTDLADPEKFPGWSILNRGQLFDVILTDGTVLHFIVGDAKSNAHTNGGTKSDYNLRELNYPQYQYLFQAYAGDTIEIFGKTGCTYAFADYYNIGDGEGQNRIACIRMYSHRLSDGQVERNTEIPAGLGYYNDDVTYVSNDYSTVTTVSPYKENMQSE